MTIKEEFKNIVARIVTTKELCKPLFYNSKNSIRFNLQCEVEDKVKYFIECEKRALIIFNDLLKDEDDVIVCVQKAVYKERNKLHKKCNVLKNIETKEDSYSFSRIKGVNDKYYGYQRILVKTKYKNIRMDQIVRGIANIDYAGRQPQLTKSKLNSGMEIYFLNIHKEILVNMYDDRGLDVASSKREVLLPVYSLRTTWILDYDREEIAKKFAS